MPRLRMQPLSGLGAAANVQRCTYLRVSAKNYYYIFFFHSIFKSQSISYVGSSLAKGKVP